MEHLEKRLNNACYSIRVLSKYLDLKTLKTVYYANFESIVRFGIIFFGHSSDTNRIFLVQKRVLRCILKISSRETCRRKFKSNKILTVAAIYIQEILIFTFKNINNFIGNPRSDYNTRNRNINLLYPVHHLTITEKNVHYSCTKIYIKGYKKSIYLLLMHLEPYHLQEYFEM
ncbi:unnamed protein product [Acanthoscelides obtectus]|uniref:Uncharacterized protein n=1 Tax=Acanthoscelides obtectus TaxID=200917 RepID=A0A9P0KRT1_ACAOB|nr:unnamed protein product [Acanthoscelides obtectus]CAK1641206.1 hypothetical protein AOBTE_LOCUS12237 [Acanthoscelides obtectus]